MVLLCWDSLSAWLLGDPTDDELCTPARRRRIERRGPAGRMSRLQPAASSLFSLSFCIDAGLRVLWAISVFFLMFILVHNFALAHFATTDEQTFFFSEAMRHMMTEVDAAE